MEGQQGRRERADRLEGNEGAMEKGKGMIREKR